MMIKENRGRVLMVQREKKPRRRNQGEERRGKGRIRSCGGG